MLNFMFMRKVPQNYSNFNLQREGGQKGRVLKIRKVFKANDIFKSEALKPTVHDMQQR